MPAQKLRLGLLGQGGSMKWDDQMLVYNGAMGKNFRVPSSAIQAVTVQRVFFQKGLLSIIGAGTTLATAKLPINWAEDAQSWITEWIVAANTRKQP